MGQVWEWSRGRSSKEALDPEPLGLYILSTQTMAFCDDEDRARGAHCPPLRRLFEVAGFVSTGICESSDEGWAAVFNTNNGVPTSTGDIMCLAVANRLRPDLEFSTFCQLIVLDPAMKASFLKARLHVSDPENHPPPAFTPGAQAQSEQQSGHSVYTKAALLPQSEITSLMGQTPRWLGLTSIVPSPPESIPIFPAFWEGPKGRNPAGSQGLVWYIGSRLYLEPSGAQKYAKRIASYALFNGFGPFVYILLGSR